MASFLLPLAVGGLTALSQGLSAFGSDRSQRDQIKAQNKATRRDFLYQTQMQAFERQQAIERYQIAVKQYEQEKQAQYEALGKNYNALQRQLDNSYRTAFYEEQQESIELAKSLGRGTTRGLSGKSAARMDNEVYQQRGRNQAIRKQNLLESGYAYRDKANILRDNAYSNVRRAYGPVAQGVKFGPNIPQPVYQSQPNRFGLYSGLLNAGIAGFNATAALSPDGNIGNLFKKPTG